ncbi:hypothetical protein [Parasulfitobacter algicola]|uniref:DUF4350 domain-containing protein n=1 Tax=Parasulfitobacter algicola TaxID=2614809 RepID=A0ABX2IK93_9RHOB|nr:hypothetical protein [Sulfitobacter algicola]NSX53292.1 hypothetical protein [Sulfitobacter algicola]
MSTPSKKGISPEIVIIAVVVVAVFVVFWLLSGGTSQNIKKSAIGMDGLHTWLTENDVDAQTFNGGWTIETETIGLRIIPLYDLNLSRAFDQPTTEQEQFDQQDIVDMYYGVLDDKISTIQTIVVLPKWRLGMPSTGYAHPDLVVQQTSLSRLIRQITGNPGSVKFADAGFTRYPVTLGQDRFSAEIYAAQTFTGTNCVPLIGDAQEMILGRCKILGVDTYAAHDEVWILSDPDLLNNHGLRLGDNALIASTLLPDLAGDGRILIDYSTSIWVRQTFTHVQPERSWADLGRFFEFPFSLLWIGFIALSVLFIWRSSVRYGAARRLFDDGPSAEKAASIAARARLLRLSGHDGALLSDYIEVRLTSFATDLFGPAFAKHGTALKEIERFLNRKDPQIASRFMSLTQSIRQLPGDIPSADAIGYVDDFETLLEQVKHDLR